MAVSPGDCGAVILAGGKSRRMGSCKALLKLGDETLIFRLACQLSGFGELWISANQEQLAEGLPGRLVQDCYPGLGPLAGLHAALRATSKNYLFCISCDMPFFTAEGARAIAAAFSPSAEAMVCRDSLGKIHPLCGIYAKVALPVIERRLLQGQLRMQELLQELNCEFFSSENMISDKMLTNVNTPKAFSEMCTQLGGSNI